MNKIPVSQLKDGDIFSDPVYIEGESLLVPAGVAVKKKDIERLNSWGIESVETTGVLVTAKPKKAKSAPASKPLSVISPLDVQGQTGSYRDYLDLIEGMDGVCNSIASSVSVEARSIDDVTSRLLQAVREKRQS